MAEELNDELIESHGIKRQNVDDDADHVFSDVIRQLDNGIEVKRRKSNFNDVQGIGRDIYSMHCKQCSA
jgi:hypothetical protein